MKRLITSLVFVFTFCSWNYAQWTTAELASANTAANAMYMSKLERDVLLYINLCRLYPQKFCELEVLPFEHIKWVLVGMLAWLFSIGNTSLYLLSIALPLTLVLLMPNFIIVASDAELASASN